MNYSKRTKPNYKRRLLLFIAGVFLIGFLTGATIALVWSTCGGEQSKENSEGIGKEEEG